MLAALLAGFVPAIVPAHAGSSVGSFEIDGNQTVDHAQPPAEPIDWDSPPPNLTHFTDGTGSADDSFNQGSKELAPGQWICQTGSAPGKGDILSGDIAFRTLNGKQFIYVDFFRATTSGDVHLDYEFSQSNAPNPSCPQLPQRTDGDIAITFDTDVAKVSGKTQHVILVRAFKWKFANNSTTTGTFTELPVGSQGTTFDAATNQSDTSSPDRGNYGEAALNLTDTIGTIGCGQFSSTYMKSRSSTSISSALQDRTTSRPALVGECPNSTLTKAVRNVTTNGAFATTANASPGDTLEYRLTYTNAGTVAASNVVVTDTIQNTSNPTYQTYVANSCSNSCTPSGTPTNLLTWNLGTQQPGAQAVVLTFRVTLASSFPVGTTHVKDVGVVHSATESNENSNETDTSVNASVNITPSKSVSQPSANVGDTVTYTITLTNSGNETGTVNVVDDYDEAHLTIGTISDGGQNNQPTAGKIQWLNIAVQPGTPKLLTYTATVHGPFSGQTGGGNCTSTQFLVHNNVTLSNGTTTGADLCVNGTATITSVKSVSPTTANEGDTVTYTITFSNSGNIAGTTGATDDYDEAHLTIGTISDNGVDDGHTITWTGIVVPPGTNTKSITYTATVHGPFTPPTGQPPCSTTQFKVHNSVTLTNGTGSNADLCVNGHSDVTPVKSADKTNVVPGDVITYTIQLSNSGNIPGTVTVVDDYDQAHLTISNISDGGVDNGNTITWTGIVVPPGTNTKTLTYKATVKGPFSGDNGTCQPGQFPIVNSVTVNGHTSGTTVCVTANPNLVLQKSADQTVITPGGLITYTLAYSNTGPAEATNTVITETVPTGTTFDSCTGGCQVSGSTVTWNVGTVPALTGSGTVTLTVRVDQQIGCQICNVAQIASPKENNGGAVNSNTVCIGGTPGPNPAAATATGNATGADVASSLLGIDLTLPTGNDGPTDHTSVNSSQAGIGSNAEANQVLGVDIPPPAPGSVLHADVLRATSGANITAVPSRAVDQSVGSAANVNILNGTVTATLVRGVATAEATGTSVEVDSAGSAIEGLNVLGIPQAVYPGAKVDLPAAIFGTDSYVAIYEEVKGTATPSGTSGGTYSGQITVNMIHVHVTNMALVGAVEVVVGQAFARADFPQTTLCGAQVHQAVSGSAFIVRVLTDPSIAPILVGAVEIPTSGGSAQQSLNTVVIDPLVTSKTATSNTQGSFTPLNTTSTSYAEAKTLCVLNTATGCTIAARLVHAQANSVATGINRTSDSAGTDFVGLKVGALTISLPVAPNTVITLPGIGFVILNEQFCDNGGTLAANCSNGTVAGHTGITVRAIHVVLLDPAAGGAPGVDIIVAEAHSDARFV